MKRILKNFWAFCIIVLFAGNVIAQNTAPEVTRIEILPAGATLDDDLTCSYDYYDADGDPENTSQRFVAWQRNGVWQPEFRDQLMVPASATGDNETWEVFLRVHDGTAESVTTYRASVNFGTPVPNTVPEVRNMQILPSNPTSSDDLNLSYDYYDAEGDLEDVSQRFIAWQRNGEWTHIHRELMTVPAADTRKGEVWNCELRVSDGKDRSIEYWVRDIIIGNSPPVITNLSITPLNPNVDDVLTASYTYSDYDNDTESGREIRWYRDTVLQPDYNDQLSVPASATASGEQWYFTVHPNDGETFGELQTSSTVTISGNIYSLSISVSPEGTGTIEPSAGVHTYSENTVVNIVATGAEGYQFVNWTGNVANSNSPSTTVTMTEDQEVTAHFEIIANELQIAVSPAGGGTTSPMEGTYIYEIGTIVDLSATAGEGYRFINWSGNVADPNSATTTVTMSEDQSITAHFEPIPTYNLTMQISPEDGGATEPIVGVHTYYEGTEVRVIATPNNEWQFVNWTGNVADPNDPTTTIIMEADQVVTAIFESIPEVISTPEKPDGPVPPVLYKMQQKWFLTGGSTSNLGHEVEYDFDWGDGENSGFSEHSRPYGWSKTGTFYVKARARCAVHTNVISQWSESTEITILPCTVNITVIPSEAGSVRRNPDSSEYNYDQVVTLTAIPSSNLYVFDHWSGDLNGTKNPETLTMKGEHNVTAHFRMIDEVVTAPTVLNGATTGFTKQSLNFNTNGATSNLGHTVEYQFDWADGLFSDWGISLRSHSYSDTGTYQVKSRARCQSHTNVISEWSTAHTVTIATCIVSVAINPTGAGSITKNPDKPGYDYGDTISITATPVTGWKFTGWTGDHSGNNNPATLSVRNNMSITANFEQKTYTLTTYITPSGTGNIIKSPDKAKYTHGEVVICAAIANPDSFYQFDHWSGDVSDTTKSISLTMDQAKTITAHFSPMDIKPPNVENCYPPAVAREIPKNGSIQFTLKDKAYGIALHSLQVFINATRIIYNGSDETGGSVAIVPENGNYHVKYYPKSEFSEQSNVTVQVKFNNVPGISCDSSYAFTVGSSTITTTAVATIALLGGTVVDSTNHVAVNIPIGALEESTEISIALVDTLPALPDSVTGIGVAYYFGPAGLKFNIPVTIAIPYRQSDLDDAGVVDPMHLPIYYFSTSLGTWTILPNLSVDTTNGIIYCQVAEFCYLTFGKQDTPSSISERINSDAVPSTFALMQNYPNPFNPETTIRYQIPQSSHVKLEVFNILGERVRALVDTEQQAGYYQLIWDGKNDAGATAPSGIYFYALRCDNNTTFRKAIFMK